MARREERGFVLERVANDPYDRMFDLLYYHGMRDADEIADALDYKVTFVERYIRGLRKRGWIIEEGKKMKLEK